MKRGFLLPDGCKDLIDALRLKPCSEPVIDISIFNPPPWLKSSHESPQSSATPPPLGGEIIIPENTSVRQLARLLGRKPFQIVADLMELGIFASVNQVISLDMIARVAKKYGFTVKKTG